MQSEGNNYASKINVFPCCTLFFFYSRAIKWIFFSSHGEIKSTLWPSSRKKYIVRHEAKIAFLGECKVNYTRLMMEHTIFFFM